MVLVSWVPVGIAGVATVYTVVGSRAVMGGVPLFCVRRACGSKIV